MTSKNTKIGLIPISIILLFTAFLTPQKTDGQNHPNQNRKERVANFPKKTAYVMEMPKKSNLWIFLMAGQSNMAGRGFVEPQDTIPNKRVLTIDKLGNWVYAKEPLHFYEPTMKGLDCGVSFANSLLGSIPQEVSVAIVPCAVGGSSIEQWLADSTFRGVKLLSNFKEKVAESQKYGIVKGVLWHQGESNAKPGLTSSYAKKLEELTTLFRQIVKTNNLPILIGQLGSYAQPNEKQILWDEINNSIYIVSENNKNTFLICTSDLKHKGDNLHFNSESQRILGERYALKYLEIIGN